MRLSRLFGKTKSGGVSFVVGYLVVFFDGERVKVFSSLNLLCINILYFDYINELIRVKIIQWI